ncbi:hypothetical protein [Sciscionella marina]|uniref:hypothetical protein n=1 Tax=Sciscionella marina TaxID=508770 RepID=UPI000688960F|nr:hypothetical protein [Sciscionella marina]
MSGLSRRRLLQVPMLAGLGAFGATACNSLHDKPGSADPIRRVHAPAPDGVLGANFNGAPSENLFGELGEANATWVRGFFALPDAGKAKAAQSRAIGTLLRAGAHGYGTVLSLKFPYFPNRGKPLPRKGSEAMRAEFARLDKVLEAALGKVDILVIGNEPFIECPRPDRNNGALNEFYEAIAGHVIASRTAHPGGDKTALYLGALTKLDEPGEIGKGTERWMSYVRDTPEIAGTDIHPHVADPAGVDTYLDYIRPRLGPDKKFLATEFSLVHLWQKHLTDRVSAEYAAEYHIRPDTKVWQVIKNALGKPFPQQRWYDLLRTSPWFENNRTFLRDQTEKFRATGRLAVATYGVSPDAAMSENFGPDKQPWLLNSLFASRTVRPLPDGTPAPNYAWLGEFKALQRR